MVTPPAGMEEEPGDTVNGPGVVSGTFPVGTPVGAHLVQTVEVEVRVTVETVE